VQRPPLRLEQRPPPGWDDLVRSHPHGTPFHLGAWARCVEHGLGHRARFLSVHEDGELAAGLVLHHVRSALFGARLCSSPQAAYGGPLVRPDAPRAAELAAALVRRAEEEAERLGVGWLELRHREPPGAQTEGGRWRASDLYVTVGGPLGATDDEILAQVPKKTRADCRKADLALTSEEAAAGLPAFLALFSENQHRLGTPVLPRRFLTAVAEAGELGPRVLVVRHAGTPVAACLSLTFSDQALPYYAGASAAALAVRPNHGLYLNVLRAARRAGLAWYDFGRSKRGSGSYDFKRRWGFEERPLHYRYRLVRAARPPGLNPEDPRWRRRVEAWKRLPAWAADRVGPLLSPGLS
jgi:FemAB-related protein (PEP-CTERM system-associated)